jgi:glutathionylspermidine synthase
VALVHATAYSDDRQVMVYLARELAARGLRPVLTGPDHLRWVGGRASVEGAAFSGPAAFLLRFFPAEWLPNLPKRCGWERFVAGSEIPIGNPAAALLTQSKRLPLVWDRLSTPLPTWRQLLPETRDPREVRWRREEGWVLKPALGRVGDLVGISGATEAKEWKSIRSGVRWAPRHWVAQRRFVAVPMAAPEGDVYPCLGVYTVDGRAAGVYGRASARPRIDHLARDVAVLIVEEETSHERT